MTNGAGSLDTTSDCCGLEYDQYGLFANCVTIGLRFYNIFMTTKFRRNNNTGVPDFVPKKD